MGRATNTGIDAAKTTCKRVVKKNSKNQCGFNWKKIADKTTTVGKTKSKEDEIQEIYIPPEKR